MRSTLSVDVDAPARLVFDLARDVQRWPRLLPHYLDVAIEERYADGAVTARMVAVRTLVPLVGYGIPVAWRARTWAEEANLRLRFVHIGGATAGMDVTWRIQPVEAGCHVSIEHVFEPGVTAWSTIVDRLFVQPIAGRTLGTFKAIAESVAASPGSGPGRSDHAAPAKTSS